MNTIKKQAVCLLALVATCLPGLCQSPPKLTCEPWSYAVVVSNLENSSKWYQQVFQVAEKNRMTDPGGTYRIVILESQDMSFELLELKGSLNRKEILAGKAEGTQIQGHFKIGFKVPQIDAWLGHFKTIGVDVPRVWTDAATGKKNFLVSDPDGNIVQIFN